MIAHRERWAGVEVDLLLDKKTFIKNSPLTLLEVKCGREDAWREEILKGRQRARLVRASAVIADRFERPVEILIAVVSHGRGSEVLPRIQYFDLDP